MNDTRSIAASENNQALMARRTAALPRGMAQAHPLFVSRARNAELWDVEGRRYIDFGSGIAVNNIGHTHPDVVEAVSRQVPAFNHTCFQVVGYESYLRLAERLNALAPGEMPKKTILLNTGAEAVENAIKIARAATGRAGVIAFAGAFHGRTLFTLGLTAKIDPYKLGFGPFPGDIFHAPYPCELHGISVQDAIEGVERLFRTCIEAKRVAAIIVEPVQGEGGYYPAPAAFLHQLREIADRHDIVLIADEVQTGIARTGKLFAIEHSDVIPDLITIAKGLGGGFPIAAVTGRANVMDAVGPGGIGSTFGGNPASCAAALAVLDAVATEGLCERAAQIGEHMQTRLRAFGHKEAVAGEVRGLGAMVAIEFSINDAPATDFTRAVIQEARSRGLLLLSCGMHGNVLRLVVPLTIEIGILDEGLDILAASIDTVAEHG